MRVIGSFLGEAYKEKTWKNLSFWGFRVVNKKARVGRAVGTGVAVTPLSRVKGERVGIVKAGKERHQGPAELTGGCNGSKWLRYFFRD